MATGRSKYFDYERDCEPWQHRRLLVAQGKCVAASELRLDDLQEPEMTEPMSKDDLWRRRFEGHLQHANFLAQKAIDRDIFDELTRE